MEDTIETLENQALDFQAKLDEDQKKKVDGKKVSE